jgi:hypothetical protein
MCFRRNSLRFSFTQVAKYRGLFLNGAPRSVLPTMLRAIIWESWLPGGAQRPPADDRPNPVLKSLLEFAWGLPRLQY